MAKEVKTIVHFKSQKETWQLGDGLRAHARRGMGGLVDAPSNLPNAAIGLYRQWMSDVTQGYRTWLLVSSVFEGSHDGWVSHYEGDTHPTLWLGECKINNNQLDNLKQLRFGLRKTHIKKAISYCPLEEEKVWMASRFTPRLYPASIRWNQGKVLQIWIPL